jgi:uncharacterized membrane protein
MDRQRKAFFHKLFKVSLILKGIEGLLEFVGGIILYFMSMGALSRDVVMFFRRELIEDNTDFIANFLVKLVQTFSIHTKDFVAVYLAIDGLIKLCLVISLWRKKLWAYPVAMVAISLFIVYQVYKLMFHFSYFMLYLTLIDIIIIALLRFEYKKRRTSNTSH